MAARHAGEAANRQCRWQRFEFDYIGIHATPVHRTIAGMIVTRPRQKGVGYVQLNYDERATACIHVTTPSAVVSNV